MKTIFAALMASVIAVPAFAGGVGGKFDEPRVEEPITAPAPVAPARYNWTGPYAGVTLGYGVASSSGNQADQNGWAGGVHFGYNADMGNWVIGGEADLAPAFLTRLNSGGLELDAFGRAKLRAGPKLGETGNTFAFGTVGVAVANSTDGGGTSHSDTGWLVGAGLSHAIDQSWVITGEVTHHRFRNVAGTSNDVNATGASVGLSFRF